MLKKRNNTESNKKTGKKSTSIGLPMASMKV